MSRTASAPLELAAVVRDHYDFVCSITHRLAGPGLDVDDLVQEVFVVVHRRLDSVREPERLRAWLYGVCRRVVAGERRKIRVRAALRALWGGPTPPPAVATPEREASQTELERRLYAALLELSPRRREVLILFALEEMSGKEIAALLDIPEATVWTRLHAARKDLLQRLNQGGDQNQSVREYLQWNN
ncbi:MAG: sigma-70 family RNA polymerase sigma factor [Deltaproteobacteria bacterium]|nr:sigma-70 family RNA polymerase sigma factor [Deltaproteobacteria bacterium]